MKYEGGLVTVAIAVCHLPNNRYCVARLKLIYNVTLGGIGWYESVSISLMD